MTGRAVASPVDLRSALPAVVAWVSLAILLTLPDQLGAWSIGAWGAAAASGALLAVVRRRWAAQVLISAVAAAVVLSTATSLLPSRRPAEIVEAAASARHLSALATVDQTVLPDTESFTVTVTEVRIGETRVHGTMPARVIGEPVGASAAIGTILRLDGTVAETEPGDDLAFLFFTRGPPTIVTPAPPFLIATDGLRAGFRALVADLPGAGAGLLPGLAIGDTTAVDDRLDQSMKDASLSHLTAVSGANCAVVVALVMAIGAAIGLSRRWRVAVSLLVLLGFVVLVTPGPSVLRAAVMVAVVLVATASGRPVRGVPVVALAVLVLLTVDPWMSRQYGFILSVLATVGLLVLSGPLTARLAAWMPRPIAAAVAIPLAAQLACQPVLVLLAPTLSVVGVAANMLAGPAAPVATVLGLVACLLAPVLPWLATAITWLAWAPSTWIAAVAVSVAGIPESRIAVVEGAPGATVVAVATVVALVAAFAARGRLRIVAGGTLAVAIVVGLGATAGAGVRSAVTRPADWQYAGCDIGQGDAFVVRSDDRIAVIDTGPDPELLDACLAKLGVTRIDLLVLSHFDLDHVGGTSAVIGDVDQVLVGPSDGPDADRLVTDLEAGGATVRHVARGREGTLGSLRWNLLWPPDPLAGFLPGNDASVVVHFDGIGDCGKRCLSAVFLGDLGEQSQNAMLSRSRISAVDVVEVAHHGSADQSARLYDALSATVGLIGVGADNGYGHPNGAALDILDAAGTAVARTDTEGMILVAPGDGGGVRVWTERGG